MTTKQFKTKTDVLALKPPTEKPFEEWWSSAQEGFGVRLMKRTLKGNFRRVYLCRYRNEEGKDVKEVIGIVDDLEFKDASEKAYAKLKRLDSKKHGNAKPTFKEAYEHYISVRRKKDGKKLSPVTLDGYASKFKYLHTVYDTPIDEISPQAWEKLHISIADKSGRTTAISCMRLASAIYSRLLALGEIEANPVSRLAAIGLMSDNEARTNIIKEKELKTFWFVIHNFIGTNQRDWLIWGLLMGFRVSLLNSLAWDRVNFEKKTYRVDADDIGNKAKTAIEFPIPDYVWDNIITPRAAFRQKGDKWILPSPKWPGEPLKNVRGSLKRIEAQCGIEFIPHDLRRTFGTQADAAVGNTVVTSLLLTHTKNSREHGPTSSYVNPEGHVMHEAINKVAERILSFVKPSDDKASNDDAVVVPAGATLMY